MTVIQGVGIKDVDLKGQQCPFFVVWRNMIKRCYSEHYPMYGHVTVCESWLTFSNFKAWMEGQDWEGKELDKDILNPNANCYSPENCAFVPRALNLFVVKKKGGMKGIYDKKRKTWIARCWDPFTGKNAYLGCFVEKEDALSAWRKFKHEKACQWADMMIDSRLSDALRRRYLNEEEENE